MTIDVSTAEYPFKPDFLKKGLAACRKKGKGWAKQAGGKGSSPWFFVMDRKGETLMERQSAACHGSMAFHHDTKASLVCNILHLSKRSSGPKKLLAEWIASDENPFSRFILNRETLLEDRCVVCSADIPYVWVHTVSLMTRMFNEHSPRLPFFEKYLKAGVPSYLAFLLAQNYTVTPQSVYSQSMHGVNYGGRLCLATLKNLLNDRHGISGRGLLTYAEEKSYVGSSLVGRETTQGYAPVYKTLLEKFPALKEKIARSRKNKKAEIRNPFINNGFKANLAKIVADRGEWFDIFVPFMVENYEEIFLTGERENKDAQK